MRFVKRKNEILRCRGALTCLLTRRGEVSEGRDAGAVGRSSFCIKGTEEKSLARTPPEDSGETPFHPFYTKKEAAKDHPGGPRGGPEANFARNR